MSPEIRRNEPIAVVGSACRFPGESTSPHKLWQLLSNPRDVQGKLDGNRFAATSFHHPDGSHHGTSNVLNAYLISEDTRVFDTHFFNINASEAESIDPQQRILLETVYEGLESAGLTIQSLQGSDTAVYVGVMCDDYTGIAYNDLESIPKYAATGTARSIMSNRISYFFNWNGPSMTIDTACSSSLVAVHQAVQVLRSGESRVAVASGANLILTPGMFMAESNLSMLSPTGRSQMWDAAANGYARGEGVASVVLKTLSQAIADGDHIECVIRETGINQDGRTTGITMPSSVAQAKLIRDTYAKAGLDLHKASDRCQYFEAHGTGTKAGDPQEAGAIFNAFFAGQNSEDTLYVGSVKTLIGHTEGTAGIAGLLKASAAIQNKVIPPNMHFKNLNPDLIPYYGNLKVPTEARAWPELPAGAPLRASVNSFGFGGTNAHAILESYQSPKAIEAPVVKGALPFTFSAVSEKSLVAQLENYVSFLGENKDIDLAALAHTLSRRSAFNNRAIFSASSAESLASKIKAKLDAKKEENAPIAISPAKGNSKILGVFTGQGAQWPAMGRELILSSSYVEKIIDDLEESLATLPNAADRPTWSLKAEMLKQGKESRIGEGLLSQPLCTAVQIVLVNLLTRAGVRFEAVAGHSSGEIGAAYAAGYLSASDAIRVAYYRGYYAKLARGYNGQKGGMLAAGTSIEDARELCGLPHFQGRLQVAASNSSSSVTLSGDIDAVEETMVILGDEGKFARQLKVDTAYHSHHMEPVSGPYLKSLKECGVKVLTPKEGSAKWYSSVFGGAIPSPENDGLDGEYWMKNMLQSVLFSQALTAALEGSGEPAMALEVGPHPALKGPASATIEEVLPGENLVYSGVLSRGNNDVEAFAEGLGNLWTRLGPSVPDFTAHYSVFSNAKLEILKTLPSYAWDHDKTYLYEPRSSRMYRQRAEPNHELLGARQHDAAEGEYRWRNYIKPSEIPWLKGHVIQDSILFPAAGFAVMAIEASKFVAGITTDKSIELVELHDFSIHRGLSFPDEAAGVETLFTLTNVTKTDDLITASFACDSCPNKDTGSLLSCANGKVVLRLGEGSASVLPARPPQAYALKETDVDDFYAGLSIVGYQYNDMFRGIVELGRITDLANGSIYVSDQTYYADKPCEYIVHPSTLDVSFQALFGCMGAPADGRLWTMHIPTTIEGIKINPSAISTGAALGVKLNFDASLVPQGPGATGFCGDVQVYDETNEKCLFQCERVHISTLGEPTKNEDRHLFAETFFGSVKPDAEVGFEQWVETDVQKRLAVISERSILAYLKRLHETITPEEKEKADSHRRAVLNWAAHTVEIVAKGDHPHLKKEWLNDTVEGLKPQMLAMADEYEAMHHLMFVGEKLIPFVRENLDMLEEFRKHNMLEWFYKGAEGYTEYNAYVGGIVKQITHVFPHLKILEIGAGTGSATGAVLKEIGQTYSSYTYTDISAGFFEEASEIFKEHNDKFVFKVLDIEKDVVEQGFEEGGYDLIVAANVLHATQFLDNTIANARKLLRPGGYLILDEITEVSWLRTSFMLSGMHGWWAGAADGRQYNPTVPKSHWDGVFRRNGFSGIETSTPDSKSFMAPYSVMVTQATDDKFELVRQPLASPSATPTVENLIILGGQEEETFELADNIQKHLTPFCGTVTIVEKFEDLTEDNFTGNTSVICVAELDEPVFKPFTEDKFLGMKKVIENSGNIVWAVKGAQGEQPYSRMIIGVARCLVGERKDTLRFQVIDTDVKSDHDPMFLAESLLRLHTFEAWHGSSYTPLWTLEREVYVDKNGKQLVPRYKPSKVIDERFNSTRRPIKSERSTDEAVLEIATNQDGSKYDIEEILPSTFGDKPSEDNTTVKVGRSVLTAVKVKSVGFLYVVIGTESKTQKKVLALSESQKSVITVPKTWTVACDVPEEQERALLLAVADKFVATSILGKASKGSSILVHEPTPFLAKTIASAAKEKDVKVTFTSAQLNGIELIRYVHPSTPQLILDTVIPKGLTAFVDLATTTDAAIVSARITRELPGKTKRKDATSYFNTAASAAVEPSEDVISKALAAAAADLPNIESTDLLEEVPLAAVSSVSTAFEAVRTVNWKEGKVSIKSVLAQEKVHFRPNMTYWMVGATGDLGLSITRWMIQRGARYIVLSSRNPNIDPDWLAAMAAEGAVVKVWAMDATSRPAVRSVFNKIKAEMPPIAGVANAAMVLSDGLFANMPYDTFNKIIRPKVVGTTILNELFPKNDLDWFIIFSSLTYVAGNVGQTPYAAANAFMVSLAEGRRRRGLAASVINLAGIFGVGYIARTDNSIHDRLEAMGYASISEWDFHQFFAEAVISSHPDSGRNFEISNGLQEFDPEQDSNLPFWIEIPRFSHYRVIRGGGSSGKSDKGTVSVREQLKEQTTEDGVRKVLLDGFLNALYTHLHMDRETNQISPDSGLLELGIDSLIAIDIRSWFHKELDLDVKVLQLLSGASVQAILDESFTRLSKDLIPGVQETEEAKTEKVDEKRDGSPSRGSETSGPSTLSSMVSSMTSSMLTTSTPELTSQQAFKQQEEIVEEEEEEEEVVEEVPVVEDKPPLVFDKIVPMSYGSSQFWFLMQYLEDPTTFNVQFRLALNKPINVARMEAAVHELGQRHEAFRTAFTVDPENANEPIQGILKQSQLHLEKKIVKDEGEVDQESDAMLKHIWDIERAEVIRIIHLTTSSKAQYMVFGFHHIAIDGYSFNRVLGELAALYDGKRLPAVRAQFSDFAVKQRREVESGAVDGDIKFWKSQFTTLPDPLPILPVAKVNSRQTMTDYDDVEGEEIRLDSKTTLRIQDICRANNMTKFHFFLAVLKVLLFRFLEVDSLCIGLADTNRNDSEFDLTMGYLLNELPLLFQRKDKQTFVEAVKEVRAVSYAALAHSRVPFDVLLDKLNVPRSSTHSPLFQVFMDYRQVNGKIPLPAKSDGVPSSGRTAYDIVLDITDIQGDDLRINFKLQKAFYTVESSEIMLKSYVHLVKSIATNPKLSLETVPLFDPVDIQLATELGHGRNFTQEWPETVSLRVDDVVRAHPESIALQDGSGNSYTYATMAARVDAIAESLLAAGVKEGHRVGVFQEPTADWVTCVLAMWKIGAVFIPLDLRSGLPRLASIVANGKPNAILCHGATANDVQALNAGDAKIINITSVPQSTTAIIGNVSKANSPATILFSSGTTGVPKGIILHHLGFRNHIEGLSTAKSIGKEKILQQSAYSFDLSLMQVLLALGNEGTVYVVPKKTRLDPVAVSQLVITENITWTLGTPSEYNTWLQHNTAALSTSAPNWKMATSVGEPMTHDLMGMFRALKRRDLKLYNFYGPAEITIGCNACEIKYWDTPEESQEPIAIGKVLPGYKVYILDRNLDRLPAGVTGEVVIGGPGVSTGYVNMPELTAEKYIPDRFEVKEGAKLYRSGDLGRMRSDGAVIGLGRIAGDSQIKFHGIRIELRDIENTIIKASEGAIYAAIVSVRGDPHFLAAHVHFAPTVLEEKKDQFLKNLAVKLPLPKYMCPALWVPVESMPLNLHGKIDRRAVNQLELPVQQEIVQETNNTTSDDTLTKSELDLKEIWKSVISKDVLKTVTITADTDFFHIGGNSLLLVKLQATIREKLNAVVPMADMFESSVLRNMAAKVETSIAASKIDWKKETAVDEALVRIASTTKKPFPSSSSSSGLTVLLTGSTGYLGRQVLSALVADDRISRIHCVAVRKDNPKNMPRDGLKASPKIITHEGNLASPTLGLSAEKFTVLSKEVDVIIHNGAERSFTDFYQALRGTNVLSTKELTQIALPRRIPIHFVSSGGVLDLESTPPTDGTNGYVASKWASEQYLQNAADKLLIPVHIHRVTPKPDAATPASSVSEGWTPVDESTDNKEGDVVLHHFASLCEKMKLVPSTQAGWHGTFDLISATYLVKELIESACKSTTAAPASTGKPIVRSVHYPAQYRLNLNNLEAYLVESIPSYTEKKEDYETMSPPFWAGEAKKAGLEWHVATMDIQVGTEDEGFVLNR